MWTCSTSASPAGAGWVVYANPFNRRPVVVSLAPDAVRALVFWTRNPHPLLALLPDIDARYDRHHAPAPLPPGACGAGPARPGRAAGAVEADDPQLDCRGETSHRAANGCAP
ncbi:MAG: DUF1848 domain-containing protein [Chloroflexales bacterium]|nr:DUF1848 domain-containing protein [Chloroflexales bacterium]